MERVDQRRDVKRPRQREVAKNSNVEAWTSPPAARDLFPQQTTGPRRDDEGVLRTSAATDVEIRPRDQGVDELATCAGLIPPADGESTAR